MRRPLGILALCLLWSAAWAEGPGDHAPPDAEVALVFADLNLAADWVDGLTTRLDGVPALDAAADALRAEALGPFKPFARQWGPGLDLGEGLGIYVTAKEQVRVVFAGSPRKGAATLAKLGKALNLPLKAKGSTLLLDGLPLKCAGSPWVVCQTKGLSKAPSAPVALPDDARVHVQLGGRAAAELFGVLGQGATFTLHADAQGGRLAGRITSVQAAMASPFLAPGGAPTRGASAVDARTDGVLKLGFDGPKLLASFKEKAGGQYPKPVRALLTALEVHWSGDLWLSTAGGLGHPVLSLGLLNGGGEAVLGALVDAINGAGEAKVTHAGGALVFELPGTAETRSRVRLHTAATTDALVLTLAKADADRVAQGRVQPLPLPQGFGAKGRHGLVFWSLPALFFGGFLPPFLELPSKLAPLGHLQTLLAASAGLVEAVGADVDVDGEGLSVSLWWRTL